MPTDVLDETTRTVSQVAAELPGARGASHASRQRVVRWITRGILAGGSKVRLEAVRCGGAWVTSAEAVRRFLDKISGPTAPAPVRTPTASGRAGRAAGRELSLRGL